MRFKSHFLTSIYIVTYLLSSISPKSSTPIPRRDITSGDVIILESLPRRDSTEMDMDGVETGQVPNSIPHADSSTVNYDSVVVPLGEPLDTRGRTMGLYTLPSRVAALPGVPKSIKIPTDDTQIDEQDVAAMNKFISGIVKRLDAQPSTTASETSTCRHLSKWISRLKHFGNFKNLNSIREHKLRVLRSDSSHQTDGVEPPPTLGEPLEAQGRTMVARNLPTRLGGWQDIPKSIKTPLDLTTITADDLANMGRFIDEILRRLKEEAGANEPTLNDRNLAHLGFFTWVWRLKSHWGFDGVLYRGQRLKFDLGCPQNPPPQDSASSTLPPTLHAGLLQNPVAQPHTQSHEWQNFPRVPDIAILRSHDPNMFKRPGISPQRGHMDIHPSTPQLPLPHLEPELDILHHGKTNSLGPGNMPQGGIRDTHSPVQGPFEFLQPLQPSPEHTHTQIPENWGPGRW